MRILHVTDFHFRQHWFDWLTLQGIEYDAVCLTGDLLDMFPSAKVNLHAQARWVREWLRAWPTNTPILLCTGNHDWWLPEEHVIDNDAEGGWLRKARRPGAVFVDGDAAVLHGYRFVCVPWAHAPPEMLDTQRTVTLVHTPPEGTPVSSDLGREVGDADVLQAAWALPRGSLVLSGHIHDPRRWYARVHRTWCFNPGAETGASAPNHIIIDTEARTARFHGWGREREPIRIS